MSQSPAEKKLQKAIDEFVQEEWSDGSLLRGWLLITDQTNFLDNGDQTTAVGYVFSDGQMPDHVAIGLCDMVATMLRYQFTTSAVNRRRSVDDDE